MSNLKAGAITLAGIGTMLAIGLGGIPMAMTIGLGGVAVGGVIGLCLRGEEGKKGDKQMETVYVFDVIENNEIVFTSEEVEFIGE